jgi:double-strand break repair protein AddB
LLPRIALVTDFDQLLPGAALPEAVAPLRRQLEMIRLVAQRIEADGHAPKSAAVDMAESLVDLLDEFHEESVPLDRLTNLTVEDESGYWDRSLAFLNIVKSYVDGVSENGVDGAARRRVAAEMLMEGWAADPPKDPVIIAGSTGSRGITAKLMQAVADLEQGAIVLPGFDFDLREDVWSELMSSRQLEDHPQFRFAALLSKLKASPSDVQEMGSAPDELRNALISLSLRPAKVTDQWLSEGPSLGDLRVPTKNLTLVEASGPREEANAIAVALKQAAHEGVRAALITPDGTLGRRVTATLDRWNIRPDVSSGVPLSLTPPGRFLRQTAHLIDGPIQLGPLLSLLKHPYCHSGSKGRGPHLLHSHAFEVFGRDGYVAEVDRNAIERFTQNADADRVSWGNWLSDLLDRMATRPAPTLESCLSHHIDIAEGFAAGASGTADHLWEHDDGAEVLSQIDRFREETDFSASVSFAEYARLLERTLMAESSRPQDGLRPDIMIWGTLEARVQGAQLVILGGLNEGIWPEQPSPDPWLSRKMRRDLGLLLPERQIGLSAHDYQQAVAAEQVTLVRARRNEEQETVPSRWLNRLTNLLQGLKGNHGPEALEEMRARGDQLLGLARQLDPPIVSPPADRPAPAPPVSVRPKQLSVTKVRTLVRDPYAVYAQNILRLNALAPLVTQADARLKGNVLHAIMERLFVRAHLG